MESLDDVIDAMIADRVIHRHRRVWLVVVAVVAVLAVVIGLTGGFGERTGRAVDTLQAPTTLRAGRFELRLTSARIIRTPKQEYSAAKTRLEVVMDVRNIDEDTRESVVLNGDLLRLVPGQGKDPIASNGASCHGQLNYVFVHGLPAQPCFTKFDVPVDFTADKVEIGVVGEQFDADDALLGASDKPYWHNEEAIAVVQVPTTVVTETR